MNYQKILYTLSGIFLMLFTHNVNAQNRVLKMQLQGKNYDSLFIYEFKNVPHRIKIRGIKQKNDSCTLRFLIAFIIHYRILLSYQVLLILKQIQVQEYVSIQK